MPDTHTDIPATDLVDILTGRVIKSVELGSNPAKGGQTEIAIHLGDDTILIGAEITDGALVGVKPELYFRRNATP